MEKTKFTERQIITAQFIYNLMDNLKIDAKRAMIRLQIDSKDRSMYKAIINEIIAKQKKAN